MRRAAHQLHDIPLVFPDPLAVTILGKTYAEELARTPTRQDRPYSVGLRAFLVARSRYAEDNLAQAVADGVRQYVLLGAGLDTFAYRNSFPDLRTFEVDHPATQQWKRELVAQNGIYVPNTVTYVPVDFERQRLASELAKACFDEGAPAFFAWLGVVPYLTVESFRSTLSYVRERPTGTGLVLDYSQPRSVLSPREQLMLDSLAARVGGAGEPFRLHFTLEEMRAELSGFRSLEDLGAAEINARYFQERRDQLAVRGSGGRYVCAWR